MRCRFLLLVTLSASGCSAVRRPLPVPPVSTKPVLDSTPSPKSVSRTLRPQTDTFAINVVTQAFELTENHRSDSTHRQSQFSARLSPDISGWILTLEGERISDSSTVGKNKRSTADTTESLTIKFDQEGRRAVIPPAQDSLCLANSALLSPLIARLLVPPVLTNDQQHQVASDGLTYTACSSGTRVIILAGIEFLQNEASQIKVTIKGQLRSDSTKALPLRITGLLTGEGRILLSSLQAPIAETIELTLHLDMAAESSAKKQQFKQSTTIHVRELP